MIKKMANRDELSSTQVNSHPDVDPLYWDDSYAIALALEQQHPGIDLEQVSLDMIYRWTIALSAFQDDRELANEAILAAIYQEWFEEVNPL
jgi:FeS assembly protein IscX